MLPTSILFRYVFFKALTTILAFFSFVLTLIVLVEFVENLRRSADKDDVGLFDNLWGAVLFAPSMAEQIFPFAVLIGSMITLLQLSRKLEIVVTRAAGISVWQLLSPLIVLAVLMGIGVAGLYNPMAAASKEAHDRFRIQVLGASSSAGLLQGAGGRPWLRQQSVDGQAVIHAASAAERGTLLSDVIVFVYGENDQFIERVDAETAHLEPGRWILSNATITSADGASLEFPQYTLSTFLTPDKVREMFASTSSVSFWELPRLISSSELAGLPARHYKLEYQSFLALPAFFVAMVCLAATVSLRIFRFGNLLSMIVIGIITGFVLYVMVSLTRELGTNGTISTVAAAWLPVIVAMLFSVTVLLHQEDG